MSPARSAVAPAGEGPQESQIVIIGPLSCVHNFHDDIHMAWGTFPAPTGCEVVLRQFAAQVVFVVFQQAALQRVSIGGDSLFRCSVMPHHVWVRVASGSPTIAGVRWCAPALLSLALKSSYQSITFLFTLVFCSRHRERPALFRHPRGLGGQSPHRTRTNPSRLTEKSWGLHADR